MIERHWGGSIRWVVKEAYLEEVSSELKVG